MSRLRLTSNSQEKFRRREKSHFILIDIINTFEIQKYDVFEPIGVSAREAGPYERRAGSRCTARALHELYTGIGPASTEYGLASQAGQGHTTQAVYGGVDADACAERGRTHPVPCLRCRILAKPRALKTQWLVVSALWLADCVRKWSCLSPNINPAQFHKEKYLFLILN